MHLVIAGESRCGKSTLSNLICSQIGSYNKIPIDALVISFKAIFPDLKIDYYSQQKNQFHLFVEEFFKNCVRMSAPNNNYILEGAGLPYEILLRLNNIPNVKVVYLGKTQLTHTAFFKEIRMYETNLSTGGWTKRLDDKTLLAWCKGWINKSKQHKKFCKKNNLLFFDTSLNQMETLNEIVKLIKVNQ